MSDVIDAVRFSYFSFNPGSGSLAIAGVLACALSLNTGAHAADLRFDPNSGKQESVLVYGKAVQYRSYLVSYAGKPVDPSRQTMAIYVPAIVTQSAIFMPLKTGAYREINILSPMDVTAENVNTPSTGTDGSGASRAAALALLKGMVVVSPAARGRNNTVTINGVLNEIGDGPAALVDLKAAVRYLKYNDRQIPGDSNKIVISGTSGGGAMSSLVGATGDSPAFSRYLEEIDAAPASDSVFAVSPFCPIIDLDNANAAYEYYFLGSGISQVRGGGPGHSVAITFSDNDKRLSLEMAKMFALYVNSLRLKHPVNGNTLSLTSYATDPEMKGPYRDYVYSVLGASATKFLVDSGFVNTDGSLNAAGQNYMATAATMNGAASGISPGQFISWNSATKTASLTDWAKLMQFMNRLKPVGSFDNGFFNVTGEMDLFNTDPTATQNDVRNAAGWNHFDANLGKAIENAGLKDVAGYSSAKGYSVPETVARWAAILNPMYYLVKYERVTGLAANSNASELYGSSNVAKHWRIRVGSFDRDSSPFVSMNLATALKNNKIDVDYRIAWNQPHTGSYDNTDMIDWIISVSR